MMAIRDVSGVFDEDVRIAFSEQIVIIPGAIIPCVPDIYSYTRSQMSPRRDITYWKRTTERVDDFYEEKRIQYELSNSQEERFKVAMSVASELVGNFRDKFGTLYTFMLLKKFRLAT